jgi:ABC-type antimicrobial peptide transport system permease subunit
VGSSVWIGGQPYAVIGIVKDFTNLPLQRARPTVFLRLPPESPEVKRMQFLLRIAAGDPASLVPAIREEVRNLDSTHTVPSANAVRAVIDIGGQEILTLAYLMGPLVLIGIVLTAAGIYSVLAFAVTRRSKELAVRSAIGATARDLVQQVAGQSLRLVFAGTLLGLGATFALTRYAQGAGGIFDSPGWQAFVIPVLIVVVVGGLATWIPSRRALAVNPAELLRTD